MDELAFTVGRVNPERLDEELRAVLGAAYSGLSTAPGRARVHVTGADEALRTLAEGVIAAHDPETLTAAQQARLAYAVTAARLRNTPWVEWTAADKDAILRWIAVRLNALPEREGA